MRIIESKEETTFPEEIAPAEKEVREVIKEEKPKSEISSQKEIFLIAKEIHELGNKLIELATKL